MTAKDFLKQIKKLDKLIENKTVEAYRWREIANNISVDMSRERVQSSGSHDVTSNAISAYMDLDTEIAELKAKRKYIISVMERLDAVEYDILHKIYVQDFTLKEIAVKYKKRYEWASSNHTNALDNVQRILNKRKK